MYKRIVLAYDGSPSGQQALLDCQDLAQWSQAELTLVAVLPSQVTFAAAEGGIYDSTLMAREKEAMQRVLDEGIARLNQAGHQARGVLLVGDTVDEICRHATEVGANLIVVGHRHLDSWAARWWKSPLSKALIAHAPCSVLVAITR